MTSKGHKWWHILAWKEKYQQSRLVREGFNAKEARAGPISGRTWADEPALGARCFEYVCRLIKPIRPCHSPIFQVRKLRFRELK